MQIGKYSIQYNAPVTLTFTLACCAVYLLTSILPYSFRDLFVLPGYWSWYNPMNYFRLFSYPFGHANVDHLVGNMSIFVLIAPIMEEKYGSRNIATMMLVATLVTAFFQVFLFDTGLLGASGLVFMFIVLISFADVRKGSIPLTFLLVLGFFVGKEVMGSLRQDHVSQYAHIMGGVLGAVFGFMFKDEQAKAPAAER